MSPEERIRELSHVSGFELRSSTRLPDDPWEATHWTQADGLLHYWHVSAEVDGRRREATAFVDPRHTTHAKAKRDLLKGFADELAALTPSKRLTRKETEEASYLGYDRNFRNRKHQAQCFQRYAQERYAALQRSIWASDENEWLRERLPALQHDSAENYRKARLSYDYYLDGLDAGLE